MVNKTKEEVLSAIKGSAGIISTIAKRLQCEWHTAKRLVESFDETQVAYSAEKESILDLAESKVIEAVNMGDIQTAKWYLGLIGRGRGYADKLEVEHTGELPVKIFINGVEP